MGACLILQLPDLIDQLHIKLADIVCSQTRTGTLRCMRTLAHQQTLPTLQHMLTKSIPYDQLVVCVCVCVQMNIPLETLSACGGS